MSYREWLLCFCGGVLLLLAFLLNGCRQGSGVVVGKVVSVEHDWRGIDYIRLSTGNSDELVNLHVCRDDRHSEYIGKTVRIDYTVAAGRCNPVYAITEIPK